MNMQWLKKTTNIVVALCIPALSTLPAQAMAATPSMKAHAYFKKHSLGFPEIFYRYHPGPHWDLVHASALHLAPAQIRQEKILAEEMMHDTQHGIMTLKAAYKRYKADARMPNPSTQVLIQDVKEIGQAQAYLGYEMIPYHLEGYQLLDTAQQATYHRLAHQNWIQMMKMMHH